MQSSKDYSLVGLLVESGEPKEFESLQIVHNTHVEVDAKGVVEEIALTKTRNELLVLDIPEKGLVKRISTPERIHRLTEKLSTEVHELMKRHDTRKNRQRGFKISNPGVATKNQRLSRGSVKTTTKTTPRVKENNMGNGILPDIHTFFNKSMSQHLERERLKNVKFPSMERPNGYSSKDPDGFSMRFGIGAIEDPKQAPN